MNKKLLLLALPLLALTSCGQAGVNVVDSVISGEENFELKIEEKDNFTIYYQNGIPHITRAGSSHVTYLMMSPFGSLNVAGANVKGEVSEKFYENTIIWEAEAGTPLPSSASEVVSSVSGATFRGWAYYSEDSEEIYPNYYKTVPLQDGLALKAIFDGTESSGGGGGDTPTPTPTPTQTGFGIYFSAEKIIPGVAKGTNMDGRDEYYCASVQFEAGDKFKIYDFKEKVSFIDDFAFNPWSFGSAGNGANIATYLKGSGDAWEALRSFKADVYVQLKYQDNAIYFELK